MKDVDMTIPEFFNFRKCAKLNNQSFDCYILPSCMYRVTASETFLTLLGF